MKTRLAAGIGEDRAARLYDGFVRDLAGRFAAAGPELSWGVAPPDPGFAEHFGVPPETCFVQEGDDLGARMLSALEGALCEEGSRCVLIGSDVPHLPAERVAQAFFELESADMVLGPALDGGYYLIGMGQPHDVFSGMTWSVDSVRAETQARAAARGLSVALLDEEFDVDEIEDLDRLRARLAAGGPPCPATTRILAELARS